MLNQEEFHQQVRDALHHLYDYPYLESHPMALCHWPEVGRGGPSRAHRFSRLLLESIEELNPPGESAADTSHIRFYSLLVYRYVEEWPLPDILRELGYSRSQFFREQQRAITMLASVLREKLSQSAFPPEAISPGDCGRRFYCLRAPVHILQEWFRPVGSCVGAQVSPAASQYPL